MDTTPRFEAVHFNKRNVYGGWRIMDNLTGKWHRVNPGGQRGRACVWSRSEEETAAMVAKLNG